jgi:hypothetical protein
MQIELALPFLLLNFSNNTTLDASNPVELVHAVDCNREETAFNFPGPLRFFLIVLDPELDLLLQRIFLGSIIKQKR